MKFGKRLQDEVVPQWAEFYVNYKRIKQFVHSSPLRGNEFSNALFSMLSEELGKAEALFQELLTELQLGHDELLAMDAAVPAPAYKHAKRFHRRRRRRVDVDAATASEQTRVSIAASSMVDTDDAELTSALSFASGGRGVAGALALVKNFFLFLIGDSRRRRAEHASTPRAHFLEWYSNATQLQHFAELNAEAMRKAAKKLRKHRRTDGDFAAAIEALLARSRLTSLAPRLHNLQSDISADYERKFAEPLNHYAAVSLTQEWHAKWAYVFLALALFCSVMYAPLLTSHAPAHNCLALFVLVVVLWITEAIPFFCTAMLIPIFAVPLGIIADPTTGARASATVASHVILGAVFNHVQILVMGGLTIGKAFAKTHLEMYAASALHRLTAHCPSLYLLGVMLASCVLCAFVSNIAAPLLVLGVVQRTLWEFPEDTQAPHGILLGLAFACNIGGILSPIASPQNAVAMTVLSFDNVTFAQWVGVALPIAVVSVVAAWVVVLVVWRPFADVPYIPLQVVNEATERTVSTASRIVVVAVSTLTIVLWILPANLFFGDTGIVALIPIVVFFGIGILSKDDFNNLSWHLMFLLAGGNMLGMCAHDSHLLDVVANGMRGSLTTASPYVVLVTILCVVAVVTTFVSHTVAAMILLPIIVKVGFLLPPSTGYFAVTPQSLVMLSALMCSGAMAFPISSFPNVNSLLAENQKGVPYLQAKDFLLSGTIITLLFLFSLCTWMVPLAGALLS